MGDARRDQAGPRSQWLPWVIGLCILIAGISVSVLFWKLRTTPQADDSPPPGPLVETIHLKTQDVNVVVQGHGTVRAKTRAQILAEVGGRIEYVSPQLTAGGFFEAGQTLLRIDAADYELALSQAEARVAEASAAIEVARAAIQDREAALENARIEADQIQELFDAGAANKRELDRAVSARKQAEAQLSSAEAQLVSAQAAKQAAEVAAQKARVDLGRVDVEMPFDGRVLTENIDPGQYVNPSTVLAEVYGLEAVEVVVPLEDAKLKWLDVPLTPGAASRMNWSDFPRVAVAATFAGEPVQWEGRAVRIEGQLDPMSRVVRVVVEVREPYTSGSERPPLMPGTFVDVDIQGQVIHDAVAVPRHAVHQGDVVWVIEQGKLRIQPVSIVRSDRTSAYITEGLPVTAEVIVSQLDTVTDGMRVRAVSASDAAAGDSSAAASSDELARRAGGSGGGP